MGGLRYLNSVAVYIHPSVAQVLLLSQTDLLLGVLVPCETLTYFAMATGGKQDAQNIEGGGGIIREVDIANSPDTKATTPIILC